MELELRVQPKSSRNRIEKAEGGRLKVRVTVPPEGGKANRAVIELLSKALKVPKSSIEVVRGETSRNKVIFIEGIDVATLQEKLGIEVVETT
ncbi:MAG: DUF167 domain-containing protein [Desulfurobacteriaceae bacterium]